MSAGEARRPRSLAGVYELNDFEVLARKRLPAPVFGYVAGGTEDDVSLHANRADFAALRLVPRVLAGHTTRDLSVELFGRRLVLPVGVAPMGLSALAAYDGDVALVRGAARRGSLAVVSATALTSLERAAAEGARWFQAYLPGDDDRVLRMATRVASAGYETFVVTADVPVNGNRAHNLRNGFSTPLRPTPRLAWQGLTRPRWLVGTALRTLAVRGMPHFENGDVERGPPLLSASVERSFRGREGLNWRHLAMLRDAWRGPLVLKGVLAPADAERARELGIDGVIVSNHGGRQLDGARSSIAALPHVVAAAGDMAVMLDSGVRRGVDVVKALALGARFVFVGRPFLYAASIAGEAGVEHAFDLLAGEIDRTLTLLGLASTADLSPAAVASRGHDD